MPGDSRPPFPALVSANPGGRPRKTDEMRRAEELMRSRSEDGVRDLIKLSEESEDDNVRARLLMFRYEAVHGKAPQAITGPDGGALEIAISSDVARLELARLLAQLADRAPLADRRDVQVEAHVVDQAKAKLPGKTEPP